jgi:hypothetical protein
VATWAPCFQETSLARSNGGVDAGGDEDDVSYERGDTRRLESCSPSLNNWTSHHLFLLRFACGDFGGGDSAVGGTSAGWSLSVGALAVGV